MWGGLRGSLSLMYSSMHPSDRGVNRVERTLLNFFSRRRVRGGCFGVLEGRFAGDFGATARQGWAVSPRNSGVFSLGKGAMRRFSARQTVPGARGEKIFKNFLERGKNPKIGVPEVPGKWSGHTLYGVCGVIFESGGWASSSVARGALRAGTSATGTHLRSQGFAPLI